MTEDAEEERIYWPMILLVLSLIRSRHVVEKHHYMSLACQKLDEDYFKKVEAIEFAVKYDDGRDPRGILKADIVLVGVSRTSKTPSFTIFST